MSTHLENEATLVAEARPDNEGYTMSQHTVYKVIQGRPSLIEEKLNELSKDGWRPVTMSSLSLAAFVAVILERETLPHPEDGHNGLGQRYLFTGLQRQ